MMATNDRRPNQAVLEIRFIGGDARPADIRASELAEVLKSIENMLVAEVQTENREISREALGISLTQIEDQSVGLRFATRLPSLVVPVFLLISQCVRTNSYAELTNASTQNLRSLVNFAHERKYRAELISYWSETHDRSSDQADVRAVIDENTRVTEARVLEGRTTLYGRVVRAGGRSPKIMFETRGRILYCDATERIARQAGERLYLPCGLEGTAKWDADTLDLQEFVAESVVPFENRNVADAFAQIRARFGQYFDAIEDVDAFVADLRRDDSQEG